MGFDNSDMAPLLDPPLTTVSQPFYEMGAKACERLIKIIEAKKKPKAKVEVLPAEIVVRKSVV
jgi:LacI family transcriptional regulator